MSCFLCPSATFLEKWDQTAKANQNRASHYLHVIMSPTRLCSSIKAASFFFRGCPYIINIVQELSKYHHDQVIIDLTNLVSLSICGQLDPRHQLLLLPPHLNILNLAEKNTCILQIVGKNENAGIARLGSSSHFYIGVALSILNL